MNNWILRFTKIASISVLSLSLNLGYTVLADDVVESRTGITFEERIHRQPLKALGVRAKGPIRVYAVGQYGSNIFVLKMSFSVNAEKLSGALMDALQPRCITLGCTDQVAEFKQFVMGALPNGAKKGTTLVFNTGGNKVTLSVNGKAFGKITGKSVASAFRGIYTDKRAVCKMKPAGGYSSYDIFEDDLGGLVALGVVFLSMGYFLWKRRKTGLSVSEIFIYPVKSCAEQPLASSTVTAMGLEGDRILMVTDRRGNCCTARQIEKARLFDVYPTFESSQLTLIAPKSKKCEPFVMPLNEIRDKSVKVKHNEAPNPLQVSDCGDVAAKWMSQATGISNCRLVGIGKDYKRFVLVNEGQSEPVPIDHAPVSLADEAPLLLTNASSLHALNRRLKERGQSAVDMRRFRPNIVVHDLEPWLEDSWSKIRVGSVEFFVWQRCGRCTMTTIDRDSLNRSGEPLNTLNTFRELRGQRNFGVHLIPDPTTLNGNVTIHAGDKIEVLALNSTRQQQLQSQT